MDLYATCDFGFEEVLGNELRELGMKGVRPLTGGVSFTGSLEDARLVLAWALAIKKLHLVLARVDAESADDLYEGALAIPWEDYVGPDKTISIRVRGTNEALRNTRFIMQRVKDAVCDHLRDLRGDRPDVDVAHPDVRILVRLRAAKATLSIDLTDRFLEESPIALSRRQGSTPEAQEAPDTYASVRVCDSDIRVFDASAQQFADRLNKMRKQRRKWAEKNRIFAYRVYDADLPDYNMAIDVYEGAGRDRDRRRVHIAEYAPPKSIDSTRAARRMIDALNITSVVLGVSPQDIFVKQRKRAKGGSQYAQSAERGFSEGKFTTQENGLLFSVDLESYLDTGLFLDNRDVRALVGRLSAGKSFLNLFAYTCTASVYAAAAHAKFTTSVDLSNTYLEWGERNMKLNGLMDAHQEFIRADCVEWVQKTRHSKLRWDIVFVDPPTFSNSSKMGKRVWDVQRDHAELLIGASRLLTRGGGIVFTCNLRGFELDTQTLARAEVQAVDITDKTIPVDFERNAKIHHCFVLRRI